MIIIRQEQMALFERNAQLDFENKVIAHIKEHHSDRTQGLSDDILRKRVQDGILRARSYDLSWENTITAYVALLFVIAPNFDDHPALYPTLIDKNVAPNDRIDKLIERAREKDWAEARENADETAWDKLVKHEG